MTSDVAIQLLFKMSDNLDKIYAEQQLGTELQEAMTAGQTIGSWAAVKKLVSAGYGQRYFPVGTQLTANHADYGTIIFDVVGHDHHKKVGDETAHTMDLLMHHVIYNTPFDSKELLWANTTGAELAAGTYNFNAVKSDYNQDTKEDGQYQLTTTKAIPAGGGIQHSTMGAWRSSYAQSEVLKGTWTTYDASGNVIESGLACTLGSEGTNLGTVSATAANMVETIGKLNSTQRNGYGSNNYKESNIRQWMNGATASGWWTKQTVFDLPPSYTSRKGFLYAFDTDFKTTLCTVENTVARNTIFETDGTLGSYEAVQDKIYLASMAELGFGKNGDVAEDSVWEMYDGAGNTDRIKYDITSQSAARYWWMRSPYPWNARVARYVYTDGSLDYNYAYYGYGAVAACTVG